MNTENYSAEHRDGASDSLLPTHCEEETKKLEKKLAALRAEGILSGGDGPRETLRQVAHVPGALERFLKARA